MWMTIIRYAAAIIIGAGSGLLVAGAVFAFIAAIGMVSRLAQKTNTQDYVMFYEEALIFGGIFGACSEVFEYSLPFPVIIVIFLSLCTGVFYGVLAMSLAEVLDMIPILTRRGRLQKGMFYFIMAIALGKLFGSLLYGLVPGFFTPK